ncbi:hypothetical protein, partial [Peribacillus psychrosaccharolyticus]
KFSQRNILEKEGYYTKAYEYNAYLLFKFGKLKVPKSRLEFFDYNLENFFFSLSYLNHVKKDQEALIDYTIEVVDYMASIYQGKKCIKPLEKLKEHFRDIEKSELMFDVVKLRLRYYEGEFKKSLNELKTVLPFNESYSLINSNNKVDIYINSESMSIYKYGNEMEILTKTIEDNIYYKSAYFDVLFSVGAYSFLEKYPFLKTSNDTFFELEVLFNLDKLDSEYLNKEIKGLYKKEHLEIMQFTYIQAKMELVTEERIRKLVAVNPYSFGLKNLMYAFIEEDFEKAYKFYTKAIKNLEHIKYYYVEAIYYFSSYLKRNNSSEYNDWSTIGRDLALSFQYRFLIHKFDCLVNEVYQPYFEDKYELPLGKERLENIIQNNNKDKLQHQYN